MRRIISIVIAFGLGYYFLDQSQFADRSYQEVAASDSVIAEAFERRNNGTQVQGSGEVIRILADDLDGSRHQRFILRLESGQTLLIAHNIDLAPRLSQLSVGDAVEFFGEYEWNDQGGVIHWTHKDPQGRHEAGWLRHAGRMYQ